MFQNFIDLPVTVEIIHNCQQMRWSLIPIGFANHHASCSSSMTLDNELRVLVITSIASNSYADITVSKMKVEFVEKDDLRIYTSVSMSMSPLQPQAQCFFEKVILYKKNSLHAVHGASDADELFGLKMKYLQQYSNVLSDVKMTLYGTSNFMQMRCLSSRVDVAFRRPLLILNSSYFLEPTTSILASMSQNCALYELLLHEKKNNKTPSQMPIIQPCSNSVTSHMALSLVVKPQ